MTKTARDLRSAAHALRTAANALEETVTALRALSDDLNEPDPEPAWPTAPHVWHDGKVWERYDEWGYHTIGDYWHTNHLNSSSSDVRERSRRFAREAVPVVVVPASRWQAFRAGAARRECHRSEAELIAAVDSLAQEVAR